MNFVCEDLPEFGIHLYPPRSPAFPALLADIERRVGDVVDQDDADTAAILLNYADQGIAALQLVWTSFDAGGQVGTHSASYGSALSLPLNRYWNVIMPGSKRYLTRSGQPAGDNTDVRPPNPDELRSGGGFGVGGGAGGFRRSLRPIESVTLSIDGLFFEDGAFVGPNRSGMWESTISFSEAHRELAAAAPDTIDRLAGEQTDHPPRGGTTEEYRQWAFRQVARSIRAVRLSGDQRSMEMIRRWSTQPAPNFRRL